MILHLVPENKFIDMAYNTFEEIAPNKNKFIVITKREKLINIKTTPVIKMNPSQILDKTFIDSLKKYDFIVLHLLDDDKIKLVLKADRKIKFLWIGWGSDYYYLIKNKKNNLLLPKTNKLYKKLKKYEKSIIYFKNIIKKSLFLPLSYEKKIEDSVIKEAINKIDYFSPVLIEDYHLLKNSINDFAPKYIDWNYGTLENLLISKTKIYDDNILIGNSSSYTNNHLEIFDLLKKIDIGKRKIITPLSYGDITYGKEIIKNGKKYFSSNFYPIETFLSLPKYNKIISSCSIVIMNHLRQQALANIIIMLYSGTKIFLNKENPIYSYFKKNNTLIFSITELNNEFINIKLTKEEIEKNRFFLKKIWSKNSILNKTKKLINIIEKAD